MPSNMLALSLWAWRFQFWKFMIHHCGCTTVPMANPRGHASLSVQFLFMQFTWKIWPNNRLTPFPPMRLSLPIWQSLDPPQYRHTQGTLLTFSCRISNNFHSLQWRIQDFPNRVGEANHKGGTCQPFGHVFRKNSWQWNKRLERDGTARLQHPSWIGKLTKNRRELDPRFC